MRAALMQSPDSVGTHGSALAHQPHAPGTAHTYAQIDENERGFERPPPKATAELFNPKGPRRAGSNGKVSPQSERIEKDKEQWPRGDVGAAISRIASMSLEDQDGKGAKAASKGWLLESAEGL
jgi:hypothetical protein